MFFVENISPDQYFTGRRGTLASCMVPQNGTLVPHAGICDGSTQEENSKVFFGDVVALIHGQY